ncbi:hypothetical protein KC959_02755 [Candidatus Saccharibacteria bacterium]|nr:hypothetical protein [Candidatus Saccharibacteria bacterium]
MSKTRSFYVRSITFFVLSIPGAFISYLIYPVLARLLSLSQFGDYVTIIGISNQALGILLAFSVLSIALVKQYGEKEANVKARVIQKVLLWLFMALSVVLLILSPLLQQLLNIQYGASFIALAAIMLLSVPMNIWTGFLQGNKEQIRVGLFAVGSALVKFVLIIMFAQLYGTLGGLFGFALGTLLGLALLYWLPGKEVPSLRSVFTKLHKSEKLFLPDNKWYMLQAVFVVGSLVFLQNYDLIRVKALFDPASAGIYSGISVFSNALYFVVFLLIWILLPEFSVHNPTNNRRVLRTAYIVIAGLILCVLFGGIAFANKLLPLLLGQSFAGQSTTLIVASLYQISLVSVALYAFYLLVLRKKRSTLLSGSVLASCLITAFIQTSSPLRLISLLLIAVISGVLLYASGMIVLRLASTRDTAST